MVMIILLYFYDMQINVIVSLTMLSIIFNDCRDFVKPILFL